MDDPLMDDDSGREPDRGEPVISFRQLHKRFGDNVIYEGLELDVYRGETLTILGGSGTGKSVMLKCLMGLLRPDRGTIHAFGEQVSGMPEKEMQRIRQRVGMLFQGAALFDSLSVADNIAFPLVERGERDRQTIQRRVAETLELVGLPGIEQQMPNDLSGGMQKRVGLARAIAGEPEVLLYDEPTTGLDPTNVRRINALIRRLQEVLQVTSIVVTHDMDSAFAVSDRFAMLYRHQIEWIGTVEQARQTTHPIVRAFIEGNIGE